MPKVKYFRIAYHSFFLLIWMLLPYLAFYQKPGVRQIYQNPLFSPYYWLLTLSFIALFYGFTYYIVPRFYLKKKYLQFLGIVLLLFLVFSIIRPFEFLLLDIMLKYKGKPKPAYTLIAIDVFTWFLFVMIIALGLASQIIRQLRVTERRAMQAEAEKLMAVADKKTAELSFLKAQINPHFLFNTLNNIYSLAVKQNPNTAPSIMKLSNIMRYITDDATREFVTLKQELDCIRDYINLQSLRLGENITIKFEVTGDIGNKKIAPLILMTFIENIFKFGISSHELASIILSVVAEKQKIVFFCQNKIFRNQGLEVSTGIGLENTRHRLALVYPERFSLDINNDNGYFTVQLELQD